MLTDANGVRRAYAIPPGALHPEQESRQRKIAERVLPPAFRDLLRATKEPFVQAIMDLACPQLVFNRTILMGDGSFVIRPHTAASTSKGIANAFALVGELAGKPTETLPIAHQSLASIQLRPLPMIERFG